MSAMLAATTATAATDLDRIREDERRVALRELRTWTVGTSGLDHRSEQDIWTAAMRHLEPLLALTDAAVAARVELEAIDRRLDAHVGRHGHCSIEVPCLTFRVAPDPPGPPAQGGRLRLRGAAERTTMIADRRITDPASLDRQAKLALAFDAWADFAGRWEQEERSNGHHDCAAKLGEKRRHAEAFALLVRERIEAAEAFGQGAPLVLVESHECSQPDVCPDGVGESAITGEPGVSPAPALPSDDVADGHRWCPWCLIGPRVAFAAGCVVGALVGALIVLAEAIDGLLWLYGTTRERWTS